MGKIELTLTIDSYDKNGKLYKTETKECHSWVKQYLASLRALMNGTADNIKDVGGTDRPFPHTSAVTPLTKTLFAKAVEGDTNYGILVGTGTNAVNLADYTIQTKITHGSGAGQLSYGAVTITSADVVGSTVKFTVARTFSNNSGDSITIQEVVLAVLSLHTTSTTGYFTLERSLFELEVPDGEMKTLTYTISTTV